MPRKVFFSFHYQNDAWRVSQVRNSWLTNKGKTNTFIDAADWESIRRQGIKSVKNWINKQLNGTSVTVVLIGAETHKRKFVKYEIQESYSRGNGIVGIYIHNIKNSDGRTSRKGKNPLEFITVNRRKSFLGLIDYESTSQLSDIFQTYDWELDNGRANIAKWIEHAAISAGR